MAFTIDDLPKRHQAAARKQLEAGLKHQQQQEAARARGNELVAHAVRSQAEATFELQCRTLLAERQQPEQEYRFRDSRKWRFDFAWPELLFAVEIEGLTHDGGRHQRLAGFEKDLEKYEAAMLDGWTVYRCSPKMVKIGRAIETCERMLIVLAH